MQNAHLFKILFWNLKGNALDRELLDLSIAHGIQLIVLCEIPENWDFGCLTDAKSFDLVTDPTAGIFPQRPKIWTLRRPGIDARIAFSGVSRAQFVEVRPGGVRPFLLVGVHLVDRRNNDEDTRAAEAFQLAETILSQEEKLSTDRTVVVGDFNMNPFEKGMYRKEYLYGVPCKAEAEWSQKSKGGKKLFYNPAWSLLGDRSVGPPGTFFHSGGTLRWNMLDQALLRPSMVKHLVGFEVLTEVVNNKKLAASRGRPDMRVSDHFPIMVSLTL